MRSRFATIFLVLSTSVFGLDLSSGIELSAGVYKNVMGASNSSLSVSSGLANTSFPFEAEGFLDFGYLRIGMGFRLATWGHQIQTQTLSGITTTLVDTDTGTKGYFAVSLYAKYPLTKGPFVFFPLLGLEADVNVLIIDASGNDIRGALSSQQLANENQLWIKGGIGADIAFSERGFLRSEFVFGSKIASQAESDAMKNAQSAGFDATLSVVQLEVRVAIGFNL